MGGLSQCWTLRIALVIGGVVIPAHGQDVKLIADEKVFRATMAACKTAYEVGQGGNIDTSSFLSGTAKLDVFHQEGPYKITYFVASNDKSVVVAFRGTDKSLPGKEHERMNSEADPRFGLASIVVPGFENIVVQSGWAMACMSIVNQLKGAMAAHGCRDKNIILTGHNMGGAIATYATHHLMATTDLFNPFVGPPSGTKADHRLITFGMPRCVGEYLTAGSEYSFKSSFDVWAEKKSLTVCTVEMEGDQAPLEWYNGLNRTVSVYRMGAFLKLNTDSADKHGSDRYLDSYRSLWNSLVRLRVLRVICHETSETGEDEIFVKVNPVGVRYPATGYHSIAGDSAAFSVYSINPNGDAIPFPGDTLTIELWDLDTSGDDKLGEVTVNRHEATKGVQEAKMTLEGGNYSLFYRVESR